MMNTMHIVLYGTAQAREKARILLADLSWLKQEEGANTSLDISLRLSKPIEETSLISLLRQSGIYGFRLVKLKN